MNSGFHFSFFNFQKKWMTLIYTYFLPPSKTDEEVPSQHPSPPKIHHPLTYTLRVIHRTRGDWFSHNYCSSTCASTLFTDFSKNFTWNNIVFLVCNQFTMPKERTEVSCCVKYLLFFFNVFFWVSLVEKWQKYIDMVISKCHRLSEEWNC